MGFVPSREGKGRLLKKYWTVPGRKIETSVVLADSKESTSFFPDRSVSITGIVFMVSAQRATLLGRREYHEHDNGGDERGHHPYQHLDR
jgi:hypothetical protein